MPDSSTSKCIPSRDEKEEEKEERGDPGLWKAGGGRAAQRGGGWRRLYRLPEDPIRGHEEVKRVDDVAVARQQNVAVEIPDLVVGPAVRARCMAHLLPARRSWEYRIGLAVSLAPALLCGSMAEGRPTTLNANLANHSLRSMGGPCKRWRSGNQPRVPL